MCGGGTGDCDIFVRFGAQPTDGDFDESGTGISTREHLNTKKPASQPAFTPSLSSQIHVRFSYRQPISLKPHSNETSKREFSLRMHHWLEISDCISNL